MYEGNTLVPTKPIANSLVLWDGGVYDNLGAEALYKAGKGLREGIDFCLVSDASGAFVTEHRGDSSTSWIAKLWRAGIASLRFLWTKCVDCGQETCSHTSRRRVMEGISALGKRSNRVPKQ